MIYSDNLILKKKREDKSKTALQGVKQMNIDRAKHGLAPKYVKRRDMKAMQYSKEFDKLEKSGNLEKRLNRITK